MWVLLRWEDELRGTKHAFLVLVQINVRINWMLWHGQNEGSAASAKKRIYVENNLQVEIWERSAELLIRVLKLQEKSSPSKWKSLICSNNPENSPGGLKQTHMWVCICYTGCLHTSSLEIKMATSWQASILLCSGTVVDASKSHMNTCGSSDVLKTNWVWTIVSV